MSDDRNGTLTNVIDERVKVYGDPTVTFPQIAQVWSGYLGVEIQPEDVPMMMILMKSVRARQAPDYSDNTDDIEGYLDIYRKLVPGMIHARSVDEYIAKRFGPPAEQKFVEPTMTGVHEHKRRLYTSICHICGRDMSGEPAARSFSETIAPSLAETDAADCMVKGLHVAATRHTRNRCPAET